MIRSYFGDRLLDAFNLNDWFIIIVVHSRLYTGLAQYLLRESQSHGLFLLWNNRFLG